MILAISAFQLRSKIDKKASQDRSKFKQKIGEHLDPFFDGFWDQLGSILGRFWWPSWTKVGTKWHQNPTTQPIKKMFIFWKASGTLFNEFLVDFGCVLGGPEGDHQCVFWIYFGSWGPDPPKSPPRAPQEPPRAPKSQILVDFQWIFNDSW